MKNSPVRPILPRLKPAACCGAKFQPAAVFSRQKPVRKWWMLCGSEFNRWMFVQNFTWFGIPFHRNTATGRQIIMEPASCRTFGGENKWSLFLKSVHYLSTLVPNVDINWTKQWAARDQVTLPEIETSISSPCTTTCYSQPKWKNRFQIALFSNICWALTPFSQS